MEDKFDFMWSEYINGRLSLEDWLKFAEKYRSWWNKGYEEDKLEN